MYESFSDELAKIAATYYHRSGRDIQDAKGQKGAPLTKARPSAREVTNLRDISKAVYEAAKKNKPKKGKGSRGEPLHVKYGPEVHYGVGRYGTHLAVSPRGGDTAHLYRDRIYVGNSRKGKDIPLSKKEQRRAARLIRKYRRT